jgi:hypothetical protein
MPRAVCSVFRSQAGAVSATKSSEWCGVSDFSICLGFGVSCDMSLVISTLSLSLLPQPQRT